MTRTVPNERPTSECSAERSMVTFRVSFDTLKFRCQIDRTIAIEQRSRYPLLGATIRVKVPPILKIRHEKAPLYTNSKSSERHDFERCKTVSVQNTKHTLALDIQLIQEEGGATELDDGIIFVFFF